MNSFFQYVKGALIISGVVLFIIYLAMSQLCKIGIKCKNCTETSMSKENSIKDGYFIGEYVPLQKTIKLKYHDETLEFGNTWYESQWFYNSDNCLNTKKEKQEGYNIVVEFKKSNKDSFLFTLSELGALSGSRGGINEDKKEIRLAYLPDTLWLKIHEKNPVDSLGWTKELEGGMVGFVKR